MKYLSLDGFEVTLSRCPETREIVVGIFTDDAEGDDVYGDSGVPRVRLLVNDSSAMLYPMGWIPDHVAELVRACREFLEPFSTTSRLVEIDRGSDTFDWGKVLATNPDGTVKVSWQGAGRIANEAPDDLAPYRGDAEKLRRVLDGGCSWRDEHVAHGLVVAARDVLRWPMVEDVRRAMLRELERFEEVEA